MLKFSYTIVVRINNPDVIIKYEGCKSVTNLCWKMKTMQKYDPNEIIWVIKHLKKNCIFFYYKNVQNNFYSVYFK